MDDPYYNLRFYVWENHFQVLSYILPYYVCSKIAGSLVSLAKTMIILNFIKISKCLYGCEPNMNAEGGKSSNNFFEFNSSFVRSSFDHSSHKLLDDQIFGLAKTLLYSAFVLSIQRFTSELELNCRNIKQTFFQLGVIAWQNWIRKFKKMLETKIHLWEMDILC